MIVRWLGSTARLKGENVIEEYVRWMLALYRKKEPDKLTDPKILEDAVRIILRHSFRMPHSDNDDFVSLVAAEMADRLDTSGLVDPTRTAAPFLEMLNKVADTVRHKVIRAAKKRARETIGILGQIAAEAPEQDVVSKVIVDELIASFSLEEKAVLTRRLEGESVNEVAKTLKVSLSTIYRRLKEIKQRITNIDRK